MFGIKSKKHNKTLGERPLITISPVKYDGFSAKPLRKEVSISVDESQTGVIAFGATGSGKTTGFIRPALKNLLDYGCSGLVLDVKGDYVDFLEFFGGQNIQKIGIGKDCKKMNLFAGITREQFRNTITELTHESRSSDSFFGTGGIRDSVLIFDFIVDSAGRCPTPYEIYRFLDKPTEFCQALDDYITSTDSLSENLTESLSSAETEDFSILVMGKSKAIKGVEDKLDDHHNSRQYTWHTQSLKTALRYFSDPDLKAAFSDPESTSHLNCYEDAVNGITTCLQINSAKYSAAAKIVALILKERFFHDVFSVTPDQSRKRLGDKKTFLVIDEYQNYINSKSTGIDDNSFIDKSRAYGHINIFSTQGVQSLVSKIGEPETKSVLQNIRNKIFMATDDSETLKYISLIEKDPSYLLYAQKGALIAYKGSNSTTRPFSVYALSNNYIDDDFLEVKNEMRDIPDEEDAQPKKIPNPYYSINSRDFLCNWCIVYPERGQVLEDFDISFQDQIDEMIEAQDKELVTRYEKTFRELRMFSKRQIARCPIPSGGDQIAGVIKSTIKNSVETDFTFNDDSCEVTPSENRNIIIIRGGGDAIKNYTTPEIVDTVSALRENGVIGNLYVSLGHSSDKPKIQEIADFSEITPSKLGILVAKQVFNEKLSQISKVEERVAKLKEKSESLPKLSEAQGSCEQLHEHRKTKGSWEESTDTTTSEAQNKSDEDEDFLRALDATDSEDSEDSEGSGLLLADNEFDEDSHSTLDEAGLDRLIQLLEIED